MTNIQKVEVRTMVKVQKARKPKVVKVMYRNPAGSGRTGKVQSRSMTLVIDNTEVEIHSLIGAAQILGCSSVHVLQLIQAGELKAHRIGRDWLILGSNLDEFRIRRGEVIRERHHAYLKQ
jgi:excisionase family DNA binding protein